MSQTVLILAILMVDNRKKAAKKLCSTLGSCFKKAQAEMSDSNVDLLATLVNMCDRNSGELLYFLPPQTLAGVLGKTKRGKEWLQRFIEDEKMPIPDHVIPLLCCVCCDTQSQGSGLEMRVAVCFCLRENNNGVSGNRC